MRPLVYATRRSVLALAQCRAFVARLCQAEPALETTRAAGRHERRPHHRPTARRHRRQGALREGDRGGAARPAGRLRRALDQGRAGHASGGSRPRVRPPRGRTRATSSSRRATARSTRCRRARGWGPPACGGWSSLKARRPDLDVVPLRGNVDTRLRKVDAGECDAIVLARAGLVRLGLEGRATEVLSPERLAARRGPGRARHRVPRGRRRDPRHPRSACTTPRRRTCVAAERGVLVALGGDCKTPLGAHAERLGDTLRLRAFVAQARRDGAPARRSEPAGVAGHRGRGRGPRDGRSGDTLK